MTDKELLELAAKAAGITGMWDNFIDVFVPMHGQITWTPLTSDGDALRLAVKLKISVFQGTDTVEAYTNQEDGKLQVKDYDPYAATRRAIVRAAAEIGKEMK